MRVITLAALLAACTPAVTSGTPASLAGAGSQVSSPFDLATGSYVLFWDASGSGCAFSVALTPADEAGPVILSGNGLVRGSDTLSGRRAGTAPAGRYVVETVAPGCSWAVGVMVNH